MPDFGELFGELDPRQMPPHFFRGAALDYRSARKADVSRQYCGLAPRFWYIDATIRCRSCGSQFVFGAEEQQDRYERRRVHVEAFPRQCPSCRKSARAIVQMRQQYDSRITRVLTRGSLREKQDLTRLIDALSEVVERLPSAIQLKREALARQIERLLAAGPGEAEK
jgi:hypothetical protein